MLELEVVPEHGLQGEAIEFLLGEEKSKIDPYIKLSIDTNQLQF